MVENNHNRSIHTNNMFEEREENAWAQVKMTSGIMNSFQYIKCPVFTWNFCRLGQGRLSRLGYFYIYANHNGFKCKDYFNIG